MLQWLPLYTVDWFWSGKSSLAETLALCCKLARSYSELLSPLHVKGCTTSWTKHFTVLTNLFCLLSLQFDPAPRRGEPHVTRRTPDYFLWMSKAIPVNQPRSSTPYPPAPPPPHFGWKEDINNYNTVPGRIETNDWLMIQDFNKKRET